MAFYELVNGWRHSTVSYKMCQAEWKIYLRGQYSLFLKHGDYMVVDEVLITRLGSMTSIRRMRKWIFIIKGVNPWDSPLVFHNTGYDLKGSIFPIG